MAILSLYREIEDEIYHIGIGTYFNGMYSKP
ncbi:Uncharacterised protein [Budvicia aquatica]|uniref:Uncharacterized protein n=1 Tax=Budvicia aquatica TaxID=82979 RepID=A0A484ZNY0_9GAMM|nr:Uncharacterised protein [Budvicia aquatica]